MKKLLVLVLIIPACTSYDRYLDLGLFEEYGFVNEEIAELGELPIKIITSYLKYNPKIENLKMKGYVTDYRSNERIGNVVILRLSNYKTDTVAESKENGSFNFKIKYRQNDTLIFKALSYTPVYFNMDCIPLSSFN